jgi:hypothetical protein
MNYSQIAAAVYQRCNQYDPYLPNLTPELARAWGGLFEKHGLDENDLLAAAVEAVYDEHGTGYRPMPADIIKAARAIRADRAQRESEHQLDQRQRAHDSKAGATQPAALDTAYPRATYRRRSRWLDLRRAPAATTNAPPPVSSSTPASTPT